VQPTSRFSAKTKRFTDFIEKTSKKKESMRASRKELNSFEFDTKQPNVGFVIEQLLDTSLGTVKIMLARRALQQRSKNPIRNDDQ